MKNLTLYLLSFFIVVSLSSNLIEIDLLAALRDETRTITTTNWTDTQVHQYYDYFVTEAMIGNTLKTA